MTTLKYFEAVRRAIREEMERDERVFCIGEDIGAYGGAFKVTEGLLKAFGPDRVIDTPIAESAIVGTALGASLLGLRPIVEFQFMDFASNAFNQIVNFVAKNRYRWGAANPMVMRGPVGAGMRSGPFHSVSPEMTYVHTPGLVTIAPSTPTDACGLLKSAVRGDDPVMFLEYKSLYRRVEEDVPDGDFTIPIGKGAVRRAGDDLTIVSYGSMMLACLDAAETLEAEGVRAEVIDLRTLYPFDRDLIIGSLRKTNKLMIVHEDVRTGGLAAEIAATVCDVAFDQLDGPIVRVTAPHTPVPYSPPLEDAFLPSADKIAKAGRKLHQY